VKAESGKVETLQRLIAAEFNAIAPQTTLFAHRSEADLDLLLLQASWFGEGIETPDERPLVFETLLREAAENGLIAVPSDEQFALEVFRSI
jgi:hypothetical protein